jgi:hypothetical protein
MLAQDAPSQLATTGHQECKKSDSSNSSAALHLACLYLLSFQSLILRVAEILHSLIPQMDPSASYCQSRRLSHLQISSYCLMLSQH